MAKNRFLITILKGAAACGLLMLSACGNPFSGRSQNSIIPENEFHTKTEDCDQIRFSDEHLTIRQLRSIVGCLNSNHEIEAVSQLIQSLNDTEITPFVDLMNSTTDLNPNVFYALKEMYFRVKKDGRLAEVEELARLLLQDPATNVKTSEALKAMAPVIRNLIETQSLTLSAQGLDQLSSSAAFQRFVREYNDPKLISPFAQGLKDYLSDKRSTSIEALYRMLAESKISEVFSKISADPKRLQKLASFFEWIISGGRFQRFSQSLERIRTQKMVCFDGAIEIKTPLATELRDLARMSSKEATQYFTHDLKNLVIISHGYCDIPYSVTDIVNVLGEATQQSGYDEMFSLLQPLMNDDRFIAFLSSEPTRNWMKANRFLSEQHFFQDFLTMIAQAQKESLSNDGATIARILDRTLNAVSAQQMVDLITALNPILTSERQYGYQALHLVTSLVEEFPSLETKTMPGLRQGLAQFTETVLNRPQIASVLSLTSDLIRDKKLTAIIDRTLLIFDQFLNRGKTKLEYGALKIVKALAGDFRRLLLEKLPVAPAAVNTCSQLTLEWDFTVFNAKNQSSYFKQMDLIQACVNTNQTFRSAKDLALYLSTTDQFPYVLQTQKTVVNEMYALDSALSFRTIHRFLDLSRSQSDVIRSGLGLSSQMVSPLGSTLKKPELRSFLSRQLKNTETYETVAEYLNSSIAPTPDAPSINIEQLSQIDTQLDRDLFLSSEPFPSAIDKLFKMYCPTLDTRDASCDIDDDQVALYLSSPKQLIATIKSEYLNSSQTWLHPKQFSGWNRTTETPEKVSDLEYHVNPMLHQLRNGANSLSSVFTAVERIQEHRFDLYRFLKDRAMRLTLIPYIYQVPNYPAGTNREFHNRIRIRIANDLDRLELLAINADFKAFGLVQNMGMGFIREVGLSWADLPKSQWPKTLQDLKDPANVRTLAEVRDYIRSEMARFDKGILQRIGECDPRGKGGLRRWFQRRLCSNEIFDISSRLFNLRFLISLLDRELLEKDTASGGLALLRDLFYSLYEANSISQFDRFANGVATPNDCLNSPVSSKEPNDGCNKDVLTLIPKITRLGLLHQAGVAILKNQNTAARSIVSTMVKLSSQKPMVEQLSTFLSSADGIKTIESGIDFGFTSGSKVSDSLSALMPLADSIPNQNWVHAVIQLIQLYPELITDHQAVLEAALSGDGSTLRKIMRLIQNNPNTKALTWLNDLSLSLNDPLVSELATSLRELKPKATPLASSIRSLNRLRSIDSPQLTSAMADWSTVLGSEKGRSTRTRLSNWVKGPEFDQFCDVFSDSLFVDKAYNLLEQIHQNPDSRAFFNSCEDFLNLP